MMVLKASLEEAAASAGRKANNAHNAWAAMSNKETRYAKEILALADIYFQVEALYRDKLRSCRRTGDLEDMATIEDWRMSMRRFRVWVNWDHSTTEAILEFERGESMHDIEMACEEAVQTLMANECNSGWEEILDDSCGQCI